MKRAAFGILVDELHERGLEIGIAGGVIINGINALDVKPDGSPLAPFLRSSLDWLSPSPTLCALGLIISGLAWLLLLLADIRYPLATWRVGCCLTFGMIYLMIVTATMTSLEPKTAALRYCWVAVLLLLCFLATFRLFVSEKRGPE